jgi:hypothetical protein
MVATYLDLRRSRHRGEFDQHARGLEPAADEMARRLKASPQVGTVRTIDSFILADQEAKLALIAEAAKALDPVLALPARRRPTRKSWPRSNSAPAISRGPYIRAVLVEASKRLAAMTKLAMAEPAHQRVSCLHHAACRSRRHARTARSQADHDRQPA